MEAKNTENISSDIFLVASFWKSIVVLANALQTFWPVFIMQFAINLAIEKRMHEVEIILNNLQDIVKQVLKALAV